MFAQRLKWLSRQPLVALLRHSARACSMRLYHFRDWGPFLKSAARVERVWPQPPGINANHDVIKTTNAVSDAKAVSA
jgi:hypothetical protein